MFDNVKKWFAEKWQRLAWSAGAGVAGYVVLAYIVPGLLSVKVVALGGAVAAAYLVYTKVALWEINKLIDQAKAAAQDVQKKL